MGIQIPKGNKLENTKEVIIKKEDGNFYSYPKKIRAFHTKAEIDSSKYVIIDEKGNTDYAICMFQRFSVERLPYKWEKPAKEGLTFDQMIEESKKTKEMLATPKQFMNAFLKAYYAREGQEVIYDATGNALEGQRSGDYTYNLENNCFTRLNAGLVKGSGFLGLDLITVDFDGSSTRAPLEKCLEEEGWALTRSLNFQGFPTENSPIKEISYHPGWLVYFIPPKPQEIDEQGSVAIFIADPMQAGIKFVNPKKTDPRLGGFTCAKAS